MFFLFPLPHGLAGAVAPSVFSDSHGDSGVAIEAAGFRQLAQLGVNERGQADSTRDPSFSRTGVTNLVSLLAGTLAPVDCVAASEASSRRGRVWIQWMEWPYVFLWMFPVEAGCRPIARAWHSLRHTMASHYVMAGGSLLALSKILGHSDIKVTMLYAHLAPDFIGSEMNRIRF